MDQPHSQNSDAEVWSDFKRGSQEAFSYLYRTHYRKLYNYGYSIIADKELLKDALQELFLELWRDREKLGQAQSIQVYLLVSFRRKVFGKIRSIRKKRLEGEDPPGAEDSYETSVIARQEEEAQGKRLSQELNCLPKRQKEAIYLRFYQELTYQQITEIMNLQYQTVRDLICKGLKTLRQNLKTLLLF